MTGQLVAVEPIVAAVAVGVAEDVAVGIVAVGAVAVGVAAVVEAAAGVFAAEVAVAAEPVDVEFSVAEPVGTVAG